MNNNKIDRQLNTDELEQVTGGDEIANGKDYKIFS